MARQARQSRPQLVCVLADDNPIGLLDELEKLQTAGAENTARRFIPRRSNMPAKF